MRRLVWLCLALPLIAQHQEKEKAGKHPAIGNPEAIAAGQKSFLGGCAGCHGATGEGGRGPNLRSRVMWHALDDDGLFKIIKNGAKEMPPANVPDEQVWNLVAFVKFLTAPAIETPYPGDAAAGEKLFWGKAQCSGCHRIRSRGGMFGPDLSNVAAVRSATLIREAILDPDADGAAGYRNVIVTKKDGKLIRGVARNWTNYSLQVQDRDGNLHLLRSADIESATIAKGSPMPKDFAKRLSADEIQNLVAYLARQSTREESK